MFEYVAPAIWGRDVDAVPPIAAASQSAAQRGVHGQGGGDDHMIYSVFILT